MKFTKFSYKRYLCNLSSSIISSKSVMNNKDIIILQAKLENNKTFYGEVSPLQNFSKENIDDCEKIINDLLNKNFFYNNIKSIKNDLNLFDDFPSLKYGIEQLIFGVESQNNFNSFTLNQKKININGIIGILDSNETINKTRYLVDKAFQTIKLKIGREFFEEDLKIVDKIFNQFNDRLILRLDVNGKWNLSEAINNISKLSKYNIQFIEQPVKDKSDLIKLAEKFNNIAPDESLTNYNETETFINSDLFNFIILKPSIRIGFFDSIKLIELANKKEIKAIVTSSYETLIGRTALIYLASLTNHNLAHGLGTELLELEDLKVDQNKYFQPQIKINSKIVFPKLKLNI